MCAGPTRHTPTQGLTPGAWLVGTASDARGDGHTPGAKEAQLGPHSKSKGSQGTQMEESLGCVCVYESWQPHSTNSPSLGLTRATGLVRLTSATP